MRNLFNRVLALVMLGLLMLGPALPVASQSTADLAGCRDLAFSTEEDFLTQGPLPPDGNPLISDGDLLGPNHTVCARNRDLLTMWQLDGIDLGLDAVDVIGVDRPSVVVFSTELNDPGRRFTQGDLLSTQGMAIPNAALLARFQLRMDLGLDGVHLVGDPGAILVFLNRATPVPRDEWLANPGLLIDLLHTLDVDIWFSTEGTAPAETPNAFLDGDVLSARDGIIVLAQPQLLDPPVPAGIPARGVDFGLDALTAARSGDRTTALFSSEILYRGPRIGFTDGDVLKLGGAIAHPHSTLVGPFEPKAGFLGLDAFYQGSPSDHRHYLPHILRNLLKQ